MPLSKDELEKLLKKCEEFEKIMKANINLIPISNWQFDGEIIEQFREQKHKLVDKNLTVGQRKKLSKASKQRLARGMGVDFRTVTDVLEWMAKNGIDTKPKKLSAALPTYNEVGAKINDGHNEASNPLKISSKNVETNISNRKKKRKRKHDESSSGNIGKNASLLVNSSATPADIVEVRKLTLKRLKEKLEQFKAKRRGKMTAHEYEEKRKLKRRMSKLKMKQRKTLAKQQQKSIKLPQEIATPSKRPKLANGSEAHKNDKTDEKMIFSNFNFTVKEEKQKLTRKERRDKFTGKDYKRLLEKAQKRDERLAKVREKNPEKAHEIEDNIQWKRALNRVEGQKVKDNQDLLKKSLKKKEKIKDWRKKKWNKRVEHTEHLQARRQEKRARNIQARKDMVKKKRLQKARKKGRVL